MLIPGHKYIIRRPYEDDLHRQFDIAEIVDCSDHGKAPACYRSCLTNLPEVLYADDQYIPLPSEGWEQVGEES